METVDGSRTAHFLAVWVGACAAFVLAGVVGCDTAGAPQSNHGAASTGTLVSELPSDAELRDRIDAVLEYTLHQRELRLDTHAAWQIIHGIVAFGPQFPVVAGNQRVAALDWVLQGNPMKGWNMRAVPDGVEAVLEPGTKTGQGHPDQWLGYLALWKLPSSTPLKVGAQEYQVADLVTHAMKDVYEGKEMSWTLMALSTYLPPSQEWLARDNSVWTLERLIGLEAGAHLTDEAAQEQINMAACGGSHRLVGMTFALNQVRERMPNETLAGGWAIADQRIRWAVDQAKKHQLPSGAFSVHYFSRPSGSADLAEHLGATGHTLEFLTMALEDEELAEPWVTRSAAFLCDVFEKTKSVELECGALYHAAHGLALYRQRRFGPQEYLPASEPTAPLARPAAQASVLEESTARVEDLPRQQ